MTKPAIFLERVDSPISDSCPSCGKALDGAELDYVYELDVTGDPRMDAGLFTGKCPACNAIFYELNMCVISKTPDGYSFINDNCWRHSTFEIYKAKIGKLNWALGHHTGLKEVSFGDALDHKEIECDWLDSWSSEPFFVSAPEDLRETTERMVKEYGPIVLAKTW